VVDAQRRPSSGLTPGAAYPRRDPAANADRVAEYSCRHPGRFTLLRLATAILGEIDEEWETSRRIYINWHSPDA
jgi:hypothetical protein